MRTVLSVLGRFVGAVVSLGLVALVVVANPWRPASPAAVPALDVAVPAAPTDLVCPGPARLPTEPDDSGATTYDPQFAPAPQGSATSLTALTLPRGTAGAAQAVVRALADPGDQRAQLAASGGAGVWRADDPGAALVMHADATDGGAARLAGSVVVRTDAGDLRGLVGAACRPAGNEAWLVGGGTGTGSSARLVLQNPGSTAASVALEVWGTSGKVELVGSADLLVPPGGERAVMLEGLAAAEPHLVVHVLATGGAVAAYLQDSALDGLTPMGVDDVVPGAAPATAQVLAGVSVAGGGAGADPGFVRLLAPGEDATAEVVALGPSGSMTLAEDLELPAGEVVDLPLTGVPAGTWTVHVTASAPVVAGAAIVRTGKAGDLGSPVDRAWVPSATDGAGAVALPAHVTWRLSVTGAATAGDGGTASATVEVVGAGGAVLHEQRVSLRAGAATALGPAELGVEGRDVAGIVLVPDEGALAWGVVVTATAPDGELVSWLGPVPATADEESVGVRLD